MQQQQDIGAHTHLSPKNMEPMKPSTISADTHIDINESHKSTAPLLQRRTYARSISLLHDELQYFRITLKCCALDHSSCINKSLSYLVFVTLTIVVPILSSFLVHIPATSPADDPISLSKLVQLPESSLAAIAFVTLANFFRQYGLRQLLFLDELQDDSHYVRREYTRELDKAFKHLAYILLPSFLFEIVHKVLFFSTVTVSMPYFTKGLPPPNVMVFIVVLASWVYRTGVFLLVCVFFKLTSELQILRFEGFKKLFEGCESGSDTRLMFKEHMRIRKLLSITSHMYRFFIIMCLVSITASQFGALFLVLASKSKKNFFNSGGLVACSAVQLSGFLLCLMGAARITHRAQGIVSIATKWHMQVTSASNTGFNLPPPETNGNREPNCIDNFITIPSQEKSSYHTRLALVSYLQHNNGGITLFGFTLDRGLLHTLFAFEFSLVLWILSKVVVLS